MSNTFDPVAFLDFTTDEALVKRPPLPVGDYIGIIGEPKTRAWVSPKDPTKSGIACDYDVEVDVPQEVQEQLALSTSTLKLKLGLMLDTKPDGKSLDLSPGKNGQLRRLREALDMNKPGEAFSLRMPQGRPIRLKVGHREYPPGSGDLFEEIVGMAKV